MNNEVFYVKLDIDNGIPKFNIVSTSDRTISGLHFRNKNGYDSTSDRSVSNLHFRNKNGYDSTSDKLGFKL